MLEAEHPGDATDVLKAYARESRKGRQETSSTRRKRRRRTNAIQDEDESLNISPSAERRRRRQATCARGGVRATMRPWIRSSGEEPPDRRTPYDGVGRLDRQCVPHAKHDDDDEPPMRLGGIEFMALGWGATRVSAG